jgi:hypothetical protein
MRQGRPPEARTAPILAIALERKQSDIAEFLAELKAEKVVAREIDATTGEEIWIVTAEGADRINASS